MRVSELKGVEAVYELKAGQRYLIKVPETVVPAHAEQILKTLKHVGVDAIAFVGDLKFYELTSETECRVPGEFISDAQLNAQDPLDD